MNGEERQFLLTATWMFMRHGQNQRARALCEALVEDAPRDGIAACALAQLALEEGDALRAIDVIRACDLPQSLVHAGAVLETRALKLLGRHSEAADRWHRYLESKKGASRQWIG